MGEFLTPERKAAIVSTAGANNFGGGELFARAALETLMAERERMNNEETVRVCLDEGHSEKTLPQQKLRVSLRCSLLGVSKVWFTRV